MEMDINQCANYIKDKLLGEGITVSHDDIVKVLDYELEWMVENGFAELTE